MLSKPLWALWQVCGTCNALLFFAIISNQLFNNQVNKIYKLLNYKYYGNKNIYLYHTVLSPGRTFFALVPDGWTVLFCHVMFIAGFLSLIFADRARSVYMPNMRNMHWPLPAFHYDYAQAGVGGGMAYC